MTEIPLRHAEVVVIIERVECGRGQAHGAFPWL